MEKMRAAKKKVLRGTIDTYEASKRILPYVLALKNASAGSASSEAEDSGDQTLLLQNAGQDDSSSSTMQDDTASTAIVLPSPTRAIPEDEIVESDEESGEDMDLDGVDATMDKMIGLRISSAAFGDHVVVSRDKAAHRASLHVHTGRPEHVYRQRCNETIPQI